MRKEVQSFAEEMERIISKYDGKKWHWNTVTLSFLREKLVEEFVEVMVELKKIERGTLNLSESKEALCLELVDLGNICMMLFDRLSIKEEGSYEEKSK